MIRNSFSLRVLVVSFLLLALPLLIDSFIFFQNSYYAAVDEAKRSLKAEADYRMFTIMTIQPVKQVFLRELSYIMDLSESMKNPDSDAMSKALAETVHVGGEFQMFIMTIENSSQYKIIASSVPSLVNTYFISYQQLEAIVKKGEGNFVRYEYAPSSQQYIPFVYVAQVIKDKITGQPLGIIMVVSNIENQLSRLLQSSNVAQNIQFAILNADGIVFAATDIRLQGQYFNPISLKRRKEMLESGQIGVNQLPKEPITVTKTKDSSFFEFMFNNMAQIAYRAYAPNGISVMSYSVKETFFSVAVRHFLVIYTIYGLILVIGAGVTYWISSWISRPLRQLSHLMGEVRQGNLDVRFKEEPLGFEINILGTMFNSTLNNLLETIQSAQDERVKKETYQKELAITRQVQRSLLPLKVPVIKGAEISGTYLPATDVGGDFYGYLEKQSKTHEEILTIAVADAAGRGISSCLYALSLRSLLRSFTTLFDDVGEVICKSNNAFIKDAGNTGMFVTLFYAMYHTDSKILNYYSCGHVPSFVKRSDGQLLTLASSGIAIGLKDLKSCTPDSIQLTSGDILICYTEGLIKAMNDQRQYFTLQRLKAIVQHKKWSSAQEIVDHITADVQEFTHSKPQEEEIIFAALMVK